MLRIPPDAASRAANTLKNVGFVRELRRRWESWQLRRALADQVRDLPCITLERFQRIQPPLFERFLLPPSMTAEELSDVDHPSFSVYFRITAEKSGGLHVTDRFPTAPFFTRQRMLATVYDHLGTENIQALSLGDIGGCNGYYSFLAEPHGFAMLDVYDVRRVHERQHALLRKHARPASRTRFHLLDASTGMPPKLHDLLLVQGVLYHLYDHYGFLRALYQATNRWLLLDTELSGRADLYNLCKLENPEDPRMGATGIALYPSYLTVLALLQQVGFATIARVLPPDDVADLHGYRHRRRVMLLCAKPAAS